MNRRTLITGALPLAIAASLPLVARGEEKKPDANPGGGTWERIRTDKVLKIGVALLEPWYFKDTTNSDAPGAVTIDGVTWRGIGIAFANEVAKAMGVKLQIVETTWGNAVAGLQTGQFDTFFMLDATPTRALSVDFVPAPMLWYPMSLLTGGDVQGQNWEDFNNERFNIGVALGTNSDEFITATAPKATISRFQNSAEIFAALQSGRVNAGLISAVAADLARARIGRGKTIVPKPAVYIPGGIAVRQENDTRWLNYLNTCAGYFYTTGKTQKFYEDFLKFRGIDPKGAVPVQRELA